LPDTEFYRRGNGSLRRECKACFKAAKNARADRDRDHYREVARRSYRKADGAAAKRRAREANPELYAEITERYESANRGRHKSRYYRDVEATRAKNRAAYQANPEQDRRDAPLAGRPPSGDAIARRAGARPPTGGARHASDARAVASENPLVRPPLRLLLQVRA
jgi:hypothetical protein